LIYVLYAFGHVFSIDICLLSNAKYIGPELP